MDKRSNIRAMKIRVSRIKPSGDFFVLIRKGGRLTLSSGMALQCDIIPATGTDYFTSNIEDGIALADEALRQDLASRYPEAWARITRRRTFMTETLGIALKPEVLPLSNIPAWLPPFWLAPHKAMAMR